MTFKLVLLLIVLILCFLADNSNQEIIKSKRISNIVKRYLNRESKPTKPNQAPWHVFLPSLRCSGALVNKRWVVTAASCFSQASEDVQGNLRVTKIRSDDGFIRLQIPLLVRLGNHHSDVSHHGEDMIPCLHVLIYPKFNENNLDGDLALLYLVREPILSRQSQLHMVSKNLVLPTRKNINYLQPNIMLSVTGWGFKSGTKTPFSVLHSDIVTFSSVDVCNNTGHYSGVVTLNMICSEGLACCIDGGSPLVADGTNGKPSQLVGVFSWGRSCALDRKQAVYAKIGGEMLQWLVKMMTVQGETLIFINSTSIRVRLLVYNCLVVH